MIERNTQIVIVPTGKPIYDEQAISVTIVDESGGEFVEVESHIEGCGKIAINPEDWPPLRAVIDAMIADIKKNEPK